jgi:hypothetical protein
MGRNRIYEETAIAVEIDGEILVWVNGSISGNRELLKQVKLFSDIGMYIDITPNGPTIVADLSDINNPIGALAALMSPSPGRARILEIPDSVAQLIFVDQQEEIYV